MGRYIAILPDADRGMPRWGVAPSHGQGARIGSGAPLAVAQPQARQRHMESEACPSQARFRCPPTPKPPCTLADRDRERRKPPLDHGLPLEHRQAPARRLDPRDRRGFRQDCTAPSLASGGDGFSPRAFVRADRAVHHREESNDGTHETKPAELRRRRMGPQPGQGVPGPENRPVPSRVARERAQAHPVARAPRLGTREEAGGSVRRRLHRRARRHGGTSIVKPVVHPPRPVTKSIARDIAVLILQT